MTPDHTELTYIDGWGTGQWLLHTVQLPFWFFVSLFVVYYAAQGAVAIATSNEWDHQFPRMSTSARMTLALGAAGIYCLVMAAAVVVGAGLFWMTAYAMLRHSENAANALGCAALIGVCIAATWFVIEHGVGPATGRINSRAHLYAYARIPALVIGAGLVVVSITDIATRFQTFTGVA